MSALLKLNAGKMKVSVKSLRVILDLKLTCKNRVEKVAKKLIVFYIIYYSSESIPRRLFITLDNCSVVLLDSSQELRCRLQVMQNSGVRHVMGLRRDDHASPHRSSLDYLRTDTRRRYFMDGFIYRIVRIRVPDCLVGLFTREVLRECVAEDTKLLELPLIGKEYGIKLFQVQEARE